MLRKIVATSCLTLLSLGAAMPAMAASWGPVSSTYKSQVRVRASGEFYKTSSSTGVQSKFVLTDPIADGNNVYGRADTQFYRYCSVSSSYPGWCTENRKNTREYARSSTQNTWTIYLSVTGFRSDASQVRGIHTACAQMGFPVPDSCSGGAYVTLSY
jgi:hypothetical protein